jgi:hypothetical protein
MGWCMPVVPATKETEVGEAECEANLDKDKHEIQSEKQTKESKRTGVSLMW